jgi:hypothetical protein
MRVRTLGLAVLLGVGLALAPRPAHAQTEDGAIPDPIFPFPLYHNHPAKGGLFTTGEFVFYRQTNPLEHQPIAFRGFFDATGQLTGRVGQFVGSAALALDARDAGGPGSYQPGFRVGIGYRFQNALSVEFSWMYLTTARYFHVATIIPPVFRLGTQLEETFITSPVYNFTNFYAGPAQDLQIGPPGGTYGIWNAADIMTIQFTQKTQQYELAFRTPIHETECWRSYGLVGPRFFWIWERFFWRTEDQDFTGTASSLDVAHYTNIVSNRMYGVFLGVGNEWYLGGGFALSCDLSASLYLDYVRERAKYELGEKDFPGAVKRAKNDYALVPEVRANVNLWWYPIEGIQLRVGYNVMAFFNTIAAPHPVSFDPGALDPPWERRARFFDGLNAGIALIF